MITYSVSMRRNLGSDAATQSHLAYGTAQVSQQVTLEQLAEHMAEHYSKYGEGDIYAMLVQTVSCLREFLLEGKSVSLGKLGSFRPVLSTRGAQSVNAFTTENIRSLTVHWTKGPAFRNMMADARFEYVPTRAAQAAVKLAQRNGETTVDISAPTTGGTTPSTGGGSTTPSTGGGTQTPTPGTGDSGGGLG